MARRKREDVIISFGGDTEALDKTIGEIRRSFEKLRGTMTAFQTAVNVAISGTLVGSVVAATRSFEELSAAIEFAGGDLEELQRIASDNAVAVGDVADAWVRLKNLGLDPSRRALEAYMNVAAGTRGKTVMDFVEAVADASVLEFERLKEFGIRASNETEHIALTFRGQTQEIEKSATAIQEALIKIGEVDFAGAQAARAQTFSAALDRLGRTVANLFAARDGLPAATESINELIEVLNDPGIREGLNAIASGILSLVTQAIKAASAVGLLVSEAQKLFGFIAEEDRPYQNQLRLNRALERMLELRESLREQQERGIDRQKELEELDRQILDLRRRILETAKETVKEDQKSVELKKEEKEITDRIETEQQAPAPAAPVAPSGARSRGTSRVGTGTRAVVRAEGRAVTAIQDYYNAQQEGDTAGMQAAIAAGRQAAADIGAAGGNRYGRADYWAGRFRDLGTAEGADNEITVGVDAENLNAQFEAFFASRGYVVRVSPEIVGADGADAITDAAEEEGDRQ